MKYLKLSFYTLVILALPILLSLVGLSAFALAFNVLRGLALNSDTYSWLSTDLGTFINQNVLYLTAFTNFLTVLTLWTFYTLFNKSFRTTILKQFKPIPHKFWPLIGSIGICGIFLTSSISGLLNLSSLDPDTVANLDSLMYSQNLLITLAIVGLLVPLVEELLFRGILQSIYTKALPLGLALVLQGVFFGVFHMNLVQALPTAILGIIFGYCVYYTRSLLTGIILHGINNTLAVLLGYYNRYNPSQNPPQTIDTNAQTAALVVMMLLCSAAIYLLLYQIRKRAHLVD